MDQAETEEVIQANISENLSKEFGINVSKQEEYEEIEEIDIYNSCIGAIEKLL